MTSYVDRVIFQATTGTTGDFVVASAVTGYQTPASASAVNGATYAYAAELKNSSGTITDWEVGRGVYTSGTTSLTRATILFSSNSNAAVNFSSAPNVMLTLVGEDIPTQSSGANPTATAGNVAVNGSATTFMRSDGAPAVTTATTAVLGIVRPDNSTVTISAGVLSASLSSTGAVTSVANSTSDGTLTISPNTGNVLASLNLAQANHWTNTTDSTATGLGAIITDGGASVAKNITVGTDALLAISTPSLGRVLFGPGSARGIGIDAGKNLYIGGVTFPSTGSTQNVVIGIGSGTHISTGASNNIVIGTISVTGSSMTGGSNVVIGTAAGIAMTSGGSNVCIGANAGANIASGGSNVGLGPATLQNGANPITGSGNLAIGNAALQKAEGAAAQNVGIGQNALSKLTSGGSNIAVGQSGLTNLLTGTSNVSIGNNNGTNLSSGENYNVYIGGSVAGTAGESNTIQISDGAGNLELDYNHTTAGIWTSAAKIAVPGGANPAWTVTTTISTTGTSTNAGTLTNAPAIGNPTKWIAFNDNGTTRYIPAW